MSSTEDEKVLFDGSANSDVNHLMFFFENVTEVYSEGEIWARAFIKHLRGESFQFYFSKSTVLVKLPGETKNYYFVKRAFRENFGKKRDAQKAIETAFSLDIEEDEALLPFAENLLKFMRNPCL